jgi:ubiquinone/menaquinone biosynthesis C-methylase UbiE
MGMTRVEAPELLDAPGQPDALVAENLADIARINRWLGGSLLTRRALALLLAGRPPDAGLELLDVATGSADIPLAVRGWLGRRWAPVRLVATDLSPQIVRIAARGAGRDLALAVADGLGLPFGDGSFDAATCSLALHHFAPPEAVALLRELRRVVRVGVVVNDLIRSHAGYLGARLLGNAISANPLTRHDGPLSVRRAYTRAELRALIRAAGFRRITTALDLGYRVAMVARA